MLTWRAGMPVTESDLLATAPARGGPARHQEPEPLLHTQVALFAACAPAAPLRPETGERPHLLLLPSSLLTRGRCRAIAGAQ